MANSGPGRTPPLPARQDDHPPRTPSALERRERFARKHPGIPVTTRREGRRLLFDVTEPGGTVTAYKNAGTMMDDLEARYP
jgi:hypothetical protein